MDTLSIYPSTVDLPFRKPNCLLLKRLLFSICSIILSLIIDSITLHIIHVKLTGL